MPIKARIDMLSTGIRTPVGVEVIGKDLVEMEKIAREVEKRSRRFMEPPAPTPNVSLVATISRSFPTVIGWRAMA